jgi:hypothetical protein
MQAVLTPEQEMIADTLQRLAAGGPQRARAVLNGQPPSGGPTDELMASWSLLGLPEAAGGTGDMVGAALLAEALGQAIEPGPFLAHFLALHALAGSGAGLTAIGAGAVAALVDGGGIGRGGAIDWLVVCAEDRVRLARPAGAVAVAGIDPCCPLARHTAGATLAEAADGGKGRARVRVLLAAEACGVGRGALALAADYARTREQFGRPIGAYQAIAHRLAQAMADLEAAWSLVLHAAWAVDDDPAAADLAAAMAKAAAGDAAIQAAEACVQTHGGMGITREADPHLYLKRALAIDARFGRSAALHAEVGAARLAARAA